ncbi:hypothetical protein [Mycobacteroides abscessus]|nr:hypothetical protein [Mycobacteroides abscessus]
MAGQLLFLAVVAALIGGVIWAVVVMRKPRPQIEEADGEDDDW